jgi:hypothetical protein
MSNADWYRNKLSQLRGPEPAPQPRPSYPQQGVPQYAQQQVQPQQFQQPPGEFNPNLALPPGSIGLHDFTRVMGLWRGGKGHKLNPEPCPSCGSNQYYENLGPRRGPQPAPHCYNCGYNGLFEQGLPSSWGATTG